ncbi:MAG: hypothetical protein HPY57_13210 [Ignavibacteria bacterium]|nr:hypothetical protein [Ignavibacteria bacterium]
MLKFEKVEERLIKKKTIWKGERDRWLIYGKKCETYFYNDVDGTKTIFTSEQLKKIQQKWDIPVSINKIYPTVRQQISILSRTKPSFQIVSFDEKAKKEVPINENQTVAVNISTLVDKIVKHILYNSQAELEEEEIIRDVLVYGMGIAGIVELPERKLGTLGLKYKRIPLDSIILDPDTFERDLSDLSGYFIEKEISLEQAKRIYDPLIKAINEKYKAGVKWEDFQKYTSGIEGSQKLTATLDEKVYVCEYFDKVYTNMYFVENIDTGDIQRVFLENLEDWQKEIIEKNAIDMELNTFVRRKLMIGDYLVLEQILPITDFSIQAKFFEWGGKPYKSYGMVHFLRDMQDAFTKTIQNAIVNGMLTNNAGWTAPKGSISPEDKQKWENFGSYPGVIKEFIPQVVEGVLLKPERDQISNLSNFYPFLMDTILKGMDEISGINNILRGEPSPQIEVFSTLKKLEEIASYRLESLLNNIVVPNNKLGNVLVEYIIAYLTPEDTLVFADPRTRDGIIYFQATREWLKDFKLAKYYVISIPGEGLPTKRLSQASELFKISQNTSDPYMRNAFMKKAFELSDIGDFDDLMQEIDFAKQLEGQVQQLREMVNRLKEINKQLENRIIRAEIDNKVLLNMLKQSKEEEETENPATNITSLEKLYGGNTTQSIINTET